MNDENFWIDRAHTAEARYNTLEQSVSRVKEDSRTILDTFCARKKPDGTYDINYEKFIQRIGHDGAIELRQIIDEVYDRPS